MNYNPSEIRFNKKMSENSGKKKKLTTNLATLTLISLLLISVPVTLFSTTVYAEEPTIESVFTELGFTNIALSSIETFPSGIYQAKLLAEFGNFYDVNILNYYPVGTSAYQTIFSGPEGSTEPGGGYVIPPISKIFQVDSQFGLSMLAQYRYFTEISRNIDYPEQHAKIYTVLDSPNMFLICFEDALYGYDRDFNDMIFSLEQILPPEIISVSRYPESPSSVESVTISAQVTRGANEIESVILSYQIGSSTWTDVPMLFKTDSSGYVANIPAIPQNTQVNYMVKAFDTNGYSDVSTLYSYTVTISQRSPIAVLNYSPYVADTSESINFDASDSYDPDGTIVSYSWDFGDGTTSSDVTVSHSYEENGEYIVTLTVVDNEGLVGSKIATLTVNNRPPVAALTASLSIINEKETVSFDASSSYDLDGTIVSYTWGFGDGTAAIGVKVEHTYEYLGNYTVTLTVVDNDGATDDVTSSVTVTPGALNISPVAIFLKSAKTVNINEIATFNASLSYDPDGTITSYAWTFGDGTTAAGVAADHVYSEEGTYTVTLTVTDNDGLTDVATTNIIATTTPVQNQSPVASFTESAQAISLGESIHFDGSGSSDPDGTITSYAWTFGDGTTAAGVAADHVYSEEGTYT
ncbi:MAG: PKD domain-containing protein, partial [Dehalococcoidia bacterium]